MGRFLPLKPETVIKNPRVPDCKCVLERWNHFICDACGKALEEWVQAKMKWERERPDQEWERANEWQ